MSGRRSIYRADLHLHSCLSPCGSLDSSPTRIAQRAASLGLDLIALTDHNSALNCPTFARACHAHGIVPLFGLEATSTEEVHCLCLFEGVEESLELGRLLYQHLPEIPNIPEISGDQVFVDEEETIIGSVEKQLTAAASLSMDQIAAYVLDLNGLFIPAHIDRYVNSVSSQLGFLPEAPYSAVEVTKNPCPVDTRAYPVVTNSDAHYLHDIGIRFTSFEARAATFEGYAAALREGRVKPHF